MASLGFSSTSLGILNRSLDLTTGTFYGHLVTTTPAKANSTVADLTLATGGNYAAQALSGRAVSTDGTGAKLSFSNPTWTGLTTNNAATVKGMVVCRQTGGSPASSDPVVSFVELGQSNSVANCTTTNASVIVTTTGSFSGYSEGQPVSGTGIAAGTVILEITSSTQMVLSKEATASGTVSLTITTPNPYTPNGADFTFQIPSTGVLKID